MEILNTKYNFLMPWQRLRITRANGWSTSTVDETSHLLNSNENSELTVGQWGDHHEVDESGTGAVAGQRNALRIAAEGRRVAADPQQGSQDVK